MVRGKKTIIKLLKTEYKIGDVVPVSAIYECSMCENLVAYKKGERFLPCEERHDDEDDETWYRTNEFINFVSRNLNTEFDRIETISLRVAEVIAEISGSVWFVIFHVVWFAMWVYMNTGGSIFGYTMFDPYPFGFLTMVVSLEAIFLSTFILISQNRQSQKSELRAELDYQTNLKTEKDVAEILSILHELREEDKLIKKETDEVLREAHIILEQTTPKHKRKKRKESAGRRIMKDVGIEMADEKRN
jgi:uncharacterized membrane protein